MGLSQCNCYRCHNILETYWEVRYKMCERHLNLMLDDDYFIGICWNCMRPTIIGYRRNTKGELIIKDKYIFSKGCRHCTNDEESNINWMTIKFESKPTSYVDNQGRIQKLLTNKDGTSGSFSKKPSFGGLAEV